MATQAERAAEARMNAELSGILRSLRRESRVPAMLALGLESIMASLGAEGAAIIRGSPAAEDEPEIVHRAGMIGFPAATAATLLWQAEVGTPALSHEENGRPIAVAVCRQVSAEKLGLVLWRRRGARGWSGEDIPLMDCVAGIIWLLLEREASQHDVARSTRMDPLTALLNQRSFVAEATRHIARLERDDLPGTLMLADVDNLENTKLVHGTGAGELVLRRAAMLLQAAIRPTDLLGRTGDAEFAMWLSGADYLTAAERAESLCLEAPAKMIAQPDGGVPEVSFSIGIATRGSGEGFADLARRASQAMREVRVAGGGYWRVSLIHKA
ncbi:MAG TPA: GGDEF domain-containing protein [Acetobacteraceae bacterium]|jgi:diguanylate cyclase (GGDEF)-like protein|nr:GGDEF domain-containing protein [Acetobacteraceae bacterium]